VVTFAAMYTVVTYFPPSVCWWCDQSYGRYLCTVFKCTCPWHTPPWTWPVVWTVLLKQCRITDCLWCQSVFWWSIFCWCEWADQGQTCFLVYIRCKFSLLQLHIYIYIFIYLFIYFIDLIF